MLLVGFGFGWINAAADYSRYLPRAASTRGVVGWTTLGAALPTVILVFFGILLVGSADESLSEAIGNDPIGALTTLLPTWFLIPFALVAILGLIGGIVMDIYSSGLSLLATGVPVSRPVATAIDGTIMTVGTIVVVFFADSFLTPSRRSSRPSASSSPPGAASCWRISRCVTRTTTSPRSSLRRVATAR